MIEYLTKTAEFTGTVVPHLPKVDAMLQDAARDGWRLVNVLQSQTMGTSWEALFIFTRG